MIYAGFCWPQYPLNRDGEKISFYSSLTAKGSKKYHQRQNATDNKKRNERNIARDCFDSILTE